MYDNQNFKPNSKPNCKFNKFFLSLQQVECFLDTLCRVKRSKKIINWFKKS